MIIMHILFKIRCFLLNRFATSSIVFSSHNEQLRLNFDLAIKAVRHVITYSPVLIEFFFWQFDHSIKIALHTKCFWIAYFELEVKN